MTRVTYYLDVISSWCFWAEPAWLQIKKDFAGRAEFHWKIALCDATGLPVSTTQEEWFYRRSGTIARSPFMLSTGWMEPSAKEYLVPNLLAVAAKELGVAGDEVRLALMHAGMREGLPVNRWDIALPIAARAGKMPSEALLAKAKTSETEERIRASTAEFHAMKATQRPTFLIENSIGDKAMLSGTWTAAPLAAVIENMLEDERAYASYAAHFGSPPEK